PVGRSRRRLRPAPRRRVVPAAMECADRPALRTPAPGARPRLARSRTHPRRLLENRRLYPAQPRACRAGRLLARLAVPRRDTAGREPAGPARSGSLGTLLARTQPDRAANNDCLVAERRSRFVEPRDSSLTTSVAHRNASVVPLQNSALRIAALFN